MSRIRVGTGFMQLPLKKALEKCKPGDELQLPEGFHSLPEGLTLTGVRVVGVGDPSHIVLQTCLRVCGSVALRDLTLQGKPFSNAINLTGGACLELDNVTVIGDPGNKYPAIYVDGASLTMRGCQVVQPDFRQSLQATGSPFLTIDSTDLGGASISGGQLLLTSSSVGLLTADKQARIFGRGTVRSTVEDKLRAVVLEGESVGDFEHLMLTNPNTRELFCQESLLRIGELGAAPDQQVTIWHKGAGRVDVNDHRITVDNPDKPKPKLRANWPLAERTHLFDQLEKVDRGGTLVLDAGEYVLDDCTDRGVRLAINLQGAGPGRTIVDGTFDAFNGADFTLSNLTLRPSNGNAAVTLTNGSLTLDNVVIEQPPGRDKAAVSVDGANLTMTRCMVNSLTDEVHGAVAIVDGGKITATASELGWLRLDTESSAFLHDCQTRWMSVEGGSQVISSGRHRVLPNDAGKRVLMVYPGGATSVENLVVDDLKVEGFIEECQLTVNSVEAADDGLFELYFLGNVEGSVPDVEKFVCISAEVATAQSAGEGDEPVTSVEDDGEPADTTLEWGDSPDDKQTDNCEEDVHPCNETSETALDEPDNPMAEIMLLTGLEQVKKQINAFLGMVKFNELRRRQGLKTTGVTMHSVFLGNPGTGKTTVARLLGKALYEAGAIRRDVFVEVGRRDLVSENIGGSAILTGKVLEKARGGVLFVDEAYTLYQERNNEFAQEAVDTILAFMENHRDDIVVIFAGYEEQMQDFLRMNPGLASRAPNHFDFEDYTPDEVATIGLRALEADDYRVDEDLYRRVVTRRYANSVDGGNGRWVRNFNESLVVLMAQRVLAEMRADPTADVDPGLITNVDLNELTGGDEDARQGTVDELLAQLDELVGLASVKSWVHDLVAEARANVILAEQSPQLERPTYHMVFTGNPGTGKTTVASLVAQLFHNLGLLERSTVIEVDRTQLVGRWIGHTEEKTTRVIDNAIGGVLFVDEAYQLSSGSENDYGRQAIETFITRLENDRDRFVAIFAGYTCEMENFLAANEGLRSRVPLTIEFPDYTPDEVAQMVVRRLSRTWTFDEDEVARMVADAYEQLPDTQRSNGRWARNFCDAVVKRHKRWLIESGATGDAVLAIRTQTVAEVISKI